ncbi:hypothetical protein C2L64_51485 [Paraburkholderia hospita]|uniref:Uncharacterized protein n=1 Tax=Paraburkholderia hospita TaxID=169430 RepID=A0AAN1JNM2_9BURK|nr:hypothetical protein C2L64_51485 [Paraburkholderia hospita]
MRLEDSSRPNIDSPSRFHRYWWDWQRAASRGGTCIRGLRISRPKRLDDCRFSFESTGAPASDNEYSGFAVAPAHYIAFAGRKHACPYRVIYHLRRFTWHLYRTSNSRLSSASTGQIPNMTSACSRLATTGASSTEVGRNSWTPTVKQRSCSSRNAA